MKRLNSNISKNSVLNYISTEKNKIEDWIKSNMYHYSTSYSIQYIDIGFGESVSCLGEYSVENSISNIVKKERANKFIENIENTKKDIIKLEDLIEYYPHKHKRVYKKYIGASSNLKNLICIYNSPNMYDGNLSSKCRNKKRLFGCIYYNESLKSVINIKSGTDVLIIGNNIGVVYNTRRESTSIKTTLLSLIDLYHFNNGSAKFYERDETLIDTINKESIKIINKRFIRKYKI